MRLLLACIVLFLAPAGDLLLTDRSVSALEGGFLEDASREVQRLDGVMEFYPPNMKRLRSAAAVTQLRGLTDGASVANRVCGSLDSPFQQLFDHLILRCEQWEVSHRARRTAFVAVVFTFAVLALVLIARIAVQRHAIQQRWPGDWTAWFVLRGLPLALLFQVAVSLIGYGVAVRTMTGKTSYALGILAVPFVLLFWLERKAVMAFVGPESIAGYRPTRGRKKRHSRLAAT